MPIPKKLQPHIDAAFPDHYLTMGTVLTNGYAQITPRGPTQVYDDNHLSTWEKGFAPLVEIERVEDMRGNPITD